jgi:hypothetical protein
MYKNLRESIKSVLALLFIFSMSVSATHATGQYTFGPSAGTFYVGRQFEMNINAATDQGTSAADIEIFYDACKLDVVDALPLAGVQIFAGTMYPNYPNNGNVVTVAGCAGNIKLTGFTADPLGVLQSGGSALFGKIRFKVKDINLSGSLLDIRSDGFGPTFTLDSNISNLLGFDMLTAATDGLYELRLDKNPVPDGDDKPFFGGFSPALNASGVLIGANILFNTFDNESGVQLSSITNAVSVNGLATTTYTSASGGVTASCSATNLDAFGVCNTNINPSANLPYDALVCSTINANDLSQAALTFASTPNSAVAVTSCFRTQYDLTAPFTINNIPGKNSLNIALNTPFTFNLVDNETGSNINTLIVTVKGIDYTVAGPNFLTYTGTSTNYAITIPTLTLPPFVQNELVNVRIRAQDNATQLALPVPNQLDETYTFRIGDTLAPFVSTSSPIVGTNFADVCTTPIVNVIEDTGSGVDIVTVRIFVSATGLYYTAAGPNVFTYTGTSSAYTATIPPPVGCWPGNIPVAVGVFAKDVAGNYLDAYIYGLGGSASSTVQTIIQTVTNTINGGGGLVNLYPILPERIIKETATLTQTEIIEKIIYLTGASPSPELRKQIYNSVEIALGDLANAAEKAKINSINSLFGFRNRFAFFESMNLRVKGMGVPYSNLELEILENNFKQQILVDKDGYWTANFSDKLRGYETYTVTVRNADDGKGYGPRIDKATMTIVPWWWFVVLGLFILAGRLYFKFKNVKDKLEKMARKK